jgi:hypothetical protein
MSHEPLLPDPASSTRPQQATARLAPSKAAAGAKNGKREDHSHGLSRGALAGRIAAGAAIGSAAIAGALLFAGKVNGTTPKRVWDKVKPPGRQPRRSPANKGA